MKEAIEAVKEAAELTAVINGQKMWTSLIQYADYVWLAVRTDPDAKKSGPGVTAGTGYPVPATAPKVRN